MKNYIIVLFVLVGFLSTGNAQMHGKSLNHSVNSMDANALAFINATGTTDSTIRVAINTLVINAKAHGWWDLCKAIYPFVGGAADKHKYNLKDPRDLDAAFRLTFNGGWIHSSTGALPNGTNGYANTWLVPSKVLSDNNAHWSIYSRTNNFGGIDLGVSVDGGVTSFGGMLKIDWEGGNYQSRSWISAGSQELTPLNSDSRGWFLGSRTSSTSHVMYKNGSSIASTNSTNPAVLPAYSVFIGSYHFSTADVDYGSGAMTNREYVFATMGAGISSTIAALMYTDIQNFQTALGRQI